MKSFSAEEISIIINGKLIQGSATTIVESSAYYIEKMEASNSLLFLRKAKVNWERVAQCVPCVVVTDKELEPLKLINDCTVIKVDNIEVAFWIFVYYYRKLFHIPVIAVTGTCGKSTTKDMIKHILQYKFNITGTKLSANSRTQNLNYMLEIDDDTGAAVFETPVGNPGDITTTCKYFKPTIGIITNIGIHHIKGCKTLDNYIQSKGEMLGCVGDNGTLIINADDENIKKLPLHTFKGNLVTFGIKNFCDFQASDVQFVENGMNFTLAYRRSYLPMSSVFLRKLMDKWLCGIYKIFVPGYGEHQVYNALAALSAVHQLGVKLEEAIVLLKDFKNLPHHLAVNNGINGSIIIDDTWNINPNSLKAAIQVLNGISKGRKKIALITDIQLLGSLALEVHIEAGNMIMENGGLDILVTVGQLSQEMANQALKAGFKGEFYSFSNAEGIYELLQNKLDSNAILLVKSTGYHDRSILELVRKLRR